MSSRSSQPREKTVVDACTRLLTLRRAWHFPTTGVAIAGIPDRIAIYHGRPLVLEFKRPGGKPTPRQQHQLLMARLAGAEAHIITSRRQLEQLLDRIDHEEGRA